MIKVDFGEVFRSKEWKAAIKKALASTSQSSDRAPPRQRQTQIGLDRLWNEIAYSHLLPLDAAEDHGFQTAIGRASLLRSSTPKQSMLTPEAATVESDAPNRPQQGTNAQQDAKDTKATAARMTGCHANRWQAVAPNPNIEPM